MSRPRRWVWFFSLLALLGAGAVVAPWLYNLHMQLKPEQLDAARRRWQENGPADYNLELHQKEDEGAEEVCLVKVRGGRVAGVVVNGKPLPASELAALAKEQPLTVPDLFDAIDAGLEEDLSGGKRRNYATARFDERTGCPLRYVRVDRAKHRLAWTVKLLPAE